MQAGQQVAVGATVLTVYPREGFCAELTVEEADLGQIAVGDSVRLSFDFDAEGALTCDGTVTEISYLGQEHRSGDDLHGLCGRSTCPRACGWA